MKRFSVVAVVLFIFILSGCNGMLTKNPDGERLPGDSPPNVKIAIDGEKHETTLGAYCWGPDSNGEAECVDTAGSIDLLEDETPIHVSAGEQITLIMDYTPQPNETHLTQIKNDKEMEVEVNENQFTAPDEKGVYFYDYGVWWMDEEDEHLSHGDAFYAFVLQVK